MSRILALLVLAMLAPACSSADSEEAQPLVKAEFIELWEINWFSNTGLRANFGDIAVISARIDETCAADVWVPGVNFELAARFVSDDGGDVNDLGLLWNAAQAVWFSARDICRDRFPPGTIELGPPGVFHL